MTSLQRVVCLIGSAAALLLSAGGCTDYTYFNVDITIDHTISDQTRREVGSCRIYVLEGSRQIEPGHELTKLDGVPACKSYTTGTDDYGNPTYEVGTMDYSSARSSGTINFVVNMIEVNSPNAVTVQGSAGANVAPGQVITVPLKAKTCPRTDPAGPTACPDATQYLD